MDIGQAAQASRGDGAVMARSRSDLQRRIAEEIEMGSERRQKLMGGGPDEMPDVWRELLTLQGALMGVEQRIANLAGVLRPVIPDHTVNSLLGEGAERLARPTEEEPATEVGARLRAMRDLVSEFEDSLSVLANGVRL